MVKASQLAAEVGVTKETIYNWIESGAIPPDCVLRIGSTVRLDSKKLDVLIAAGGLQRQRAPKMRAMKHPDDAFVIRNPGVRTHAGRRCRNDARGRLDPVGNAERAAARTLRAIQVLAQIDDPQLKHILTAA